jgi:hypothetical protein
LLVDREGRPTVAAVLNGVLGEVFFLFMKVSHPY